MQAPDFLKPVLAVEPRPTDKTQSRYERSYLIMRAVIGVLGVALPLALVFWDGLVFDGDPSPRTSISAYYYSGAREVFVGTLCATGIFLITYKVSDRNLDNTLSLAAGAAAITVALLPTGRPSSAVPLTGVQDWLGEAWVQRIHFFAAGTFIISLGLLSYFFGVREGGRTPRARQWLAPSFWKRYHWTCAIAIALALLWVAVTELANIGPNERLLYGEWVAAWAFGASWLMKGLELDLLLRGVPDTAPAGLGVRAHP